MQASPIPGAGVAVVTRDSILLIWTSGVADKAARTPVSEQTLFCIGSCTKTFTGLGVLKLIDEGRVDLSTPIEGVVPEIKIDNPWRDTDPVTIGDLLEHASGFDDAHTNWFYTDSAPKSLRQCVEEKSGLYRARWRPGTRYSYSSPGYTLAGYLIEKISGEPYARYIQDSILGPIGMEDSYIGYTAHPNAMVAIGYDRNIEPVPHWYDYDVPAGAMMTSIRDMARFLQFMLRRGASDAHGAILSARSFDLIAHPQSTLAASAGIEHGYNCGVGTSYPHGAIWYGHGGAVPGFLADYRYCPDRGIAFYILQNQFGINLETDVYDIVRNTLFAVADSISPPPAAALSASGLRDLCGRYAPRNPRMQLMGFVDALTGDIEVVYEGDTLFTQGFAADKLPLIHVTETLFRRPWEPEATFAFINDRDGASVLVSRNSYFERVSVWQTSARRWLVFTAVGIMLSSLVYAVIWVPVYVVRRSRGIRLPPGVVTMRTVPLLAVTVLIAGFWPIGNQTLLDFGLPTLPNILFFVSTLLFAGFSMLSLFTAYKSLAMPVRPVAKVYAIALSLSCVGITLYLAQWGIIGLRLWAY